MARLTAGAVALERGLLSCVWVLRILQTMVVAAILLTVMAPRGLAQAPAADPDVRASGEPAVSREPEARPRRHPVRAVLGATLAFGLNLAWYWWDADFNQPDWDLQWDRESWRKKVVTFEALRLDGNRFSTNAGSHTQGGTIIYLIGRGNGLSAASSALLSFGEVVLWEYIGEFYEKPSINDMLTNPLGGLAVGEPFYQLSEFFARGADNGVNETLAAIFSPISHLNWWADGVRPRRAPDLDRLGLPRDVWHRFDLYAGLSSARWNDETERSESMLGLRTRLNTVRGYGRPERRAGFFGAGRLTSIDAGLSLSGEGMTGAVFATRVALGGYHAQNLRFDEGGDLVGHSLLVSLTNTFDYTGRRRPDLPFDQIATFAVAGPTVELAHRWGELEGAVRLEALPELSMVTSLAEERYRLRSGTEGLKLVMADHGYYYAYGVNLGGRLSVRYHAISAGLDGSWQRFESIEGLDRFQERLATDLHQTDGRARSLVWLNVRPVRGYADIGLSLERTSRFGRIADVTVSRVERRAMLTLGFAL